MIVKLVSAAAVVAVAGSASAATYRVFSHQSTSGAGVPHTVSGGTFVNTFGGGGGNFAPDASFVGLLSASADLEVDSYATIDANGPVPADGSYQTNTSAGVTSTPSIISTAAGGITSTSWGMSVFVVPNSSTTPSAPVFGDVDETDGTDDDCVFLGRVVATRGATVNWGTTSVFLEDANGQHTVNMMPGGASVDNGGATEQPYFIKIVFSQVDGANDFFGFPIPSLQPVGDVDIYDLWISYVPTPGATALFGLAGLATIRRRR